MNAYREILRTKAAILDDVCSTREHGAVPKDNKVQTRYFKQGRDIGIVDRDAETDEIIEVKWQDPHVISMALGVGAEVDALIRAIAVYIADNREVNDPEAAFDAFLIEKPYATLFKYLPTDVVEDLYFDFNKCFAHAVREADDVALLRDLEVGSFYQSATSNRRYYQKTGVSRPVKRNTSNRGAAYIEDEDADPESAERFFTNVKRVSHNPNPGIEMAYRHCASERVWPVDEYEVYKRV